MGRVNLGRVSLFSAFLLHLAASQRADVDDLAPVTDRLNVSEQILPTEQTVRLNTETDENLSSGQAGQTENSNTATEHQEAVQDGVTAGSPRQFEGARESARGEDGDPTLEQQELTTMTQINHTEAVTAAVHDNRSSVGGNTAPAATTDSVRETPTATEPPSKQEDMETPEPPNIIFIMVDDLGWNDVGYHGSEIRTPYLDKLADQGVKLENYYMAPVCGPTRAQFLSGKYSIHLGIHSGNIIACRPQGLPTQFPTIADKLKEKGYSTHLIGKWHAGFHTEDHLPTNRGFDTFRGFLLGHGDHYTHTRKYDGRPYLDFHDNLTPYNNSWGEYSTEVITDRAVELINEHHNDTRPMFMWVSYQAPHNPLQVPDRYLDEYEDISIPSRRNYAAMVSAIDLGVGQIVMSLKRSGKLRNSVIVFTTDNGGDVGSGGSNYPLRGNKGSLYEGGIRGVGFVYSSLIEQPQRYVKDLMHITDWLPTFLHLAGGAGSLDIDGVNQWQTISNAAPSGRREILHNIYHKASRRQPERRRRRRGPQRRGQRVSSETRALRRSRRERRSTAFDTDTRASLTVDSWKILTGKQSRDYIYPDPAIYPRIWNTLKQLKYKAPSDVQLYNLDLDPSERRNVAEEYPEVVRYMLRRLSAYERTVVDPLNGPVSNECDPRLRGGVWGPFLD